MLTLSKKYKYACIYILTSVNTVIKQKKIIMHACIINMRRITLNMLKMVLLNMVPNKFSSFLARLAPQLKVISQIVICR